LCQSISNGDGRERYTFEFEGEFYSALSIYTELEYLQKWLQPNEKIAEVKFKTTKSFKETSAYDEYEFICWRTLKSVSS
jgi:hypothetical protein